MRPVEQMLHLSAFLMFHDFDLISVRLFQMVRLNYASASCLQYFLEASKNRSL